jgi:hypothetical protein
LIDEANNRPSGDGERVLMGAEYFFKTPREVPEIKSQELIVPSLNANTRSSLLIDSKSNLAAGE